MATSHFQLTLIMGFYFQIDSVDIFTDILNRFVCLLKIKISDFGRNVELTSMEYGSLLIHGFWWSSMVTKHWAVDGH